jgi:hypothetical protein
LPWVTGLRVLLPDGSYHRGRANAPHEPVIPRAQALWD